MTVHDALVLAGGRGSRLGGADKPAIVLGHSTLLDRAVAAVASAQTVAVVGPVRTSVPGGTVQVCEDPPYGGPAAAIGAGLQAIRGHRVPSPLTVVLAADLPAVVPAVRALLRLVAATDPAVDGWVGTDPGGRRQYLLAAYRTETLWSACRSLTLERGSLEGAAVRALLQPLRLVEVALTAALTADIDTTADLAAARDCERTSDGISART
ncbi:MULTISPECIES: NTP transferase domain-containing protein [unclassified Curtobacterium]|uniref:molybdenum cofactor guanylyltransferase n=1 Tax=unclassified Curtobacterium TaxID=257496 RepID=UPI0015E89264|nr:MULTISPECIES: NTP transferase domain-containing protein [unclassified Curtobacterium]WIB65959.1 NTP transferase domain-containing protein [Curtobacterium sp. MCBD17_040]WIB69158.1 NTP transferase domain-containing protein [Curtobacterium sp. MCBD17_035]